MQGCLWLGPRLTKGSSKAPRPRDVCRCCPLPGAPDDGSTRSPRHAYPAGAVEHDRLCALNRAYIVPLRRDDICGSASQIGTSCVKGTVVRDGFSLKLQRFRSGQNGSLHGRRTCSRRRLDRQAAESEQQPPGSRDCPMVVRAHAVRVLSDVSTASSTRGCTPAWGRSTTPFAINWEEVGHGGVMAHKRC